ncbi:TonB-dependent receptor [Glacieibacterium frigidum]|nr:TonB-dependent receptor [Glacieibacterium frigidum]
MHGFKSKTLTTTALISAVLMALPAAAAAQTAVVADAATAETTSAEDGDIIVTARKRAEDLQSVPISMNVFTAADLAARNISNFADLANSTPGVAITSISGGTVQNIYLRGLAPANTANDLNVEANVGVFIDGIYQTSRNTLDIISVLDVGQIEIAKGPQSALFGRSTFAGALAIATKRPSRDLNASASATVGVDDDYRVRASVSAPLGGGVYARIGGGYLTYDGFAKNVADPKNNLGGTEKYAVSAALEFVASDNFTALLSGFVTHSETELTPAYVLPLGSFNCGTTNAATGLPTLFCGTLQSREDTDTTANAPDTVAKTRQLSLELNADLDGVTVVSITGYTAAENRAFNDYDGSSGGTLFGVCTLGAACSPAGAYTRLARASLLSSGVERVRTFSQEVRLQSDNNSPFQWLVGSNYFNSRIPVAAGGIGTSVPGLAANERLLQVSQTTTPAATGIGAYDFTANPFLVAVSSQSQLFSSYSRASTQTMSVFGSLGYRFGQLRVNAEGRYNIDRKRAQVFSVSNPTSQPGFNQPIDGTTVPDTGVFPVNGPKFARTFESFAPRITVDYQATPDIFLFASAAKGVRSGGFNTANAVSATGILASEVSYEEETNWTYEAGFKTRLFEERLQLNGSFFHVDWANAQVSAFTDNPTAVNPVRIVRNAGDIKVNGFELQSNLTLTDMFRVGGSVTYSDPKFQAGAYDGSTVTQCRLGTTPATFTSAPGCPAIIAVTTGSGSVQYVPSLEGNRPQRAVLWQWNVHATADVPINDAWSATGRVDVNYTGPVFSNQINTTAFGKRTLTNLRLGVENERFSIAVFANNLFDKKYISNSINQPRAGVPFAFSVPEVYLGETRRVGVTATVKY